MRKYLLGLLVLTSFQAIGQDNRNGMIIRELTPGEMIFCPKSDHVNHFYLPPQEDRTIIKKRDAHLFKDSLINVTEDYRDAIDFVFEVLEAHYSSDVVINVRIELASLGGSALAGASPAAIVSNFDYAPYRNTQYPIALAEKILGRDINAPGSPDINVTINRDADFHLVPNDPGGVGNRIDLASVLTHEIMHGMGFFESGTVDEDGLGYLEGFLPNGRPDQQYLVAYDRNIINGNGDVLHKDFISPSVELADEFESGDIFYNSESFESGVTKAKLYAPSQFAEGSSISHLDEIYNNTSNTLMTFAFGGGELIYFPGDLTLKIMRDMGWDATRITHEPALFSEDINADYEIIANVEADSGFDPATFMMHYSTDSFATEDIVIPMVLDNQTQQYTSTLPAPGIMKEYQYYFEVVDGRNITRTRPGGGPEFYFTYNYGVDTEPPVMANAGQVQLIAIWDNLFPTVDAIDDFSGVDNVSAIIKINEEDADTMQLIPLQSNNGNTYRAEYTYTRTFLPTDVVQYKFLSTDKSAASNMTIFPQDSFFRAIYIRDTIPPELTHEPVSSVTNFDNSFNIKVNFIDNFLGIKDIKGIVRINGGDPDTIDLGLKMSLFGDFYESRYTFSREFEADDIIEYSILGTDLAVIPNTTALPESDPFYVVPVRIIKEPVNFYLNNFNTPSQDFVGSGFVVGSVTGFPDDVIQSTIHPYPEGGAGLTVDFTYELDQPIIVAQNESIIEFDEIALVEPGENRVNWPSERFYDYVIVEGKFLKGTEWFPLLDGYDCTAYSEWRTKYESQLSTITQLSSAVPTSDLLRNRTIDIQENGDFSPGDTILIRFRLFSDNAAAGWGWLIDNLKIQESSTAVNDLTDQVKFRIFPNPVSSDKLNFSLDLENSYENTMLTIYNIYGSKVLHEPLGFINNRYSKSIDVQSLSKGMYFLEVRLDQHAAAIKKFIKH